MGGGGGGGGRGGGGKWGLPDCLYRFSNHEHGRSCKAEDYRMTGCCSVMTSVMTNPSCLSSTMSYILLVQNRSFMSGRKSQEFTCCVNTLVALPTLLLKALWPSDHSWKRCCCYHRHHHCDLLTVITLTVAITTVLIADCYLNALVAFILAHPIILPLVLLGKTAEHKTKHLRTCNI